MNASTPAKINPPVAFSAKRWKAITDESGSEAKYEMGVDLVGRVLKPGMSQATVRNLIGKPWYTENPLTTSTSYSSEVSMYPKLDVYYLDWVAVQDEGYANILCIGYDKKGHLIGSKICMDV